MKRVPMAGPIATLSREELEPVGFASLDAWVMILTWEDA